MVSADRLKGAEAVVIGASAGAVEALTKILPSFTKDRGLPVIVCVHLPAGRPSLLVTLFEPRCALPVAEPIDKQAITPAVWVAPPDYHLLVEQDRTFSMSVDEPVNFSRPSIDVLFESAADAYREGLVAIVLTGASSDGAEGARKVKARGGLVIVQDPAEADAEQMPRAAIEAADPQLVMNLSDLAHYLRGNA